MHHLSSLRALLGLFLALTPASLPAQEGSSPASQVTHLQRSPGFIANRGQWPDTVRYRSSGGGANAWVHDDGLTLRLKERPEAATGRGVVLRLTFDGATPSQGTHGLEQLPGQHNFIIGRDSSRWATGVPAFARTVTANAYPGIDVVWQWRDGRLAYDLHVAPGADPLQVVTRIEGASSLSLAPDGTLVVATETGEVRLTAPVSWERDGELRRPVYSRFVLDGVRSYRIAVDRVDADAPLVIDPGIEWASVYGTAGEDQNLGVAADNQDLVYAVGSTDISTFPTTPGAFQTVGAMDVDGIICCLDPSRIGAAQLLWSTYYGGDDTDVAFDVAVNPAGTRVTIVGSTRSTDLPRQNSMQPTNGGGWDAFAAQFINNGRAVRWSTYIGGNQNDRGLALQRANANAMVIGGIAGAEGFPVTGSAFQPESGGSDDAYIMVLNPNAGPGAQMVASTLFGGRSNEGEIIRTAGVPAREAWKKLDVAVDPTGGYLLSATTRSKNLPTTNGAFQAEAPGGTFQDAFVALFNANLSTLRYGSYVGGDRNDWVYGVDLNADGEIILVGTTYSTDFPVSSNPISSSLSGTRDAMVCWIDPAGNGTADLLYSTYFGESSNETLIDCHVERSGIVVACGVSEGGTQSTPGAFSSSMAGTACIVRIEPRNNGATDMHYFSRLGGGGDEARAMTPTSDGAYFVVGVTADPTLFPATPGSFSSIRTSLTEMFAARIDTLPTSITRLPVSAPACNGAIDIQVNREMGPGATPFELIFNDVPPNSEMALVLLGPPLTGSYLFLRPNMLIPGASTDSGVRVFVLPNAWQFSESTTMAGTKFLPSPYPLGAPLFKPDNGFMRMQLPSIPPPPGGQARLSIQAVFQGTTGCGGRNRLYASDRISF